MYDKTHKVFCVYVYCICMELLRKKINLCNNLCFFSMFQTPRMKKELGLLLDTPPNGVHVTTNKDSKCVLDVGNNHILSKTLFNLKFSNNNIKNFIILCI